MPVQWWPAAPTLDAYVNIWAGRPYGRYFLNSPVWGGFELTEMLLEATGKDWSYVDRVADRLGHDLRYSVDISKVRSELGYKPLVPFEKGLADVVTWYRENRAWWEPLKAKAAL